MTKTNRRRAISVGLSLALLVIAIACSLYFGSNAIGASTITEILLGHQPDNDPTAQIVLGQRLPRTIVVSLCGVCLAVAGILMQAMTRNPLADPGILGVNAGAALAVVLTVAVFGITTIKAYLWTGFLGAGVVTVAVYLLGGSGRARPEQLALAGVAVSMAINAVVQVVILTNQTAFNEFRFWAAGSAEGRGFDVIAATWVFVLIGVGIALLLAPSLNSMALGEDVARGLGVNIVRTRTLNLISIALLAGAATAAIGPIMFHGLAIAFISRWLFSQDLRWAIVGAIVLGPATLLLADVVARTIVAPHEIQVGIMTALVGGPIFVAVVRTRKFSRV